MPPNSYPTDAELRQMGILRTDTMLPPSPAMLEEGARALMLAVAKDFPRTVILEKVFSAMVLKGLEEFPQLMGREKAENIPQRRKSDHAESVPASPLSAISVYRKQSAKVGAYGGSGATVGPLEWAGAEITSGSGATVVGVNAPAGALAPSHAAFERVLPCASEQVSDNSKKGAAELTPHEAHCDCFYCKKWRTEQSEHACASKAGSSSAQ